jgi:hypothetical protein
MVFTVDTRLWMTSTRLACDSHDWVLEAHLCSRSRTLSSRHIPVPLSRMESSPLGTLPPELIFRILDFLDPLEYTGFPCTCQYALSLVNKMLDTPEHCGFTALDQDRKSRTAAIVEAKKWSLDGNSAIAEHEGPSDCGAVQHYDASEDDRCL